ncbi:hypothetical protein [Metabacillus endolithicus]|uniref:DUF4367 domain-containing protein n=1 Tax=Metabacillus endolithicus TaxID=1535204 RepID=A0ABW5C4M5_9BACI
MKSTEKKLLNAMNHIKLHSNPPEHLEERIFNKVAPKRLWRLNKVQLSVASAVLVLFFAGGITSAKMSGFFSWNKGMTYQTYETGQIRENVPTPPEILQQSLEQGKKTYNLTEAYSVADYQILRPAKELLPLKNSIGVSTDQPPEGYYPATFILWDVFENRKHNVYVAQYYDSIKTAAARGESDDIESHYFGYKQVSLSDHAIGFITLGESSIKGYRKLHVEYMTANKQVIHLVFYGTLGEKDLISFAKQYVEY